MLRDVLPISSQIFTDLRPDDVHTPAPGPHLLQHRAAHTARTVQPSPRAIRGISLFPLSNDIQKAHLVVLCSRHLSGSCCGNRVPREAAVPWRSSSVLLDVGVDQALVPLDLPSVRASRRIKHV